MKLLISLMEAGLVPRPLIRAGVRRLLARRIADESRGGIAAIDERRRAFIREMDSSPLAIHTKAANDQHYEVPTEFFKLCLGPRMKYSSAYWPVGVNTLAQAEEAMLEVYAERAELKMVSECWNWVVDGGVSRCGPRRSFQAQRFSEFQIPILSASTSWAKPANSDSRISTS